jgi:hypothetical protein
MVFVVVGMLVDTLVLSFCNLVVGVDEAINLSRVEPFFLTEKERPDLLGVDQPLDFLFRQLQDHGKIGFLQQPSGLGKHVCGPL